MYVYVAENEILGDGVGIVLFFRVLCFSLLLGTSPIFVFQGLLNPYDYNKL